MEWFQDKVGELLTAAAIRPSADRAIFGCLAGMAAAAAALRGPFRPGEPRIEPSATYTAYRIVPQVQKRIQKGAVEVFREVSVEARRIAKALPEWQIAAVAAADGRWLVKREGEAGYLAMNAQEFADFQQKLGGRGGIINKVNIDEGKITFTRNRSGKLDGCFPDDPAIRVISAVGSPPRVYAREGTVLAAPVEPYEFTAELRDPAAQQVALDDLIARAWKDAVRQGFSGPFQNNDSNMVIVSTRALLNGKLMFEAGDIAVANDGAEGADPSENSMVHSFRTGEDTLLPIGTFNILGKPRTPGDVRRGRVIGWSDLGVDPASLVRAAVPVDRGPEPVPDCPDTLRPPVAVQCWIDHASNRNLSRRSGDRLPDIPLGGIASSGSDEQVHRADTQGRR